jgi:hypothetical protein
MAHQRRRSLRAQILHEYPNWWSSVIFRVARFCLPRDHPIPSSHATALITINRILPCSKVPAWVSEETSSFGPVRVHCVMAPLGQEKTFETRDNGAWRMGESAGGRRGRPLVKNVNEPCGHALSQIYRWSRRASDKKFGWAWLAPGRGLVDRQPSGSVFGDQRSRGLAPCVYNHDVHRHVGIRRSRCAP